MGAADLLQSRWFLDRSKTLGRRFDAVWFAQPLRTQAREGTSRSESICDGPGVMCFEGELGRPGTVATEPGRVGSSALEPAELATSCSSEQEAVEHRGRRGAADTATCPGLTVRKDSASENPMSGSGPSVSARPRREQAVERARNPEDGECRVWKPG